MGSTVVQSDGGIRKDGSTTTIAEIPFVQGTRNYANLTIDSSVSATGVMLTEGSQAIFYDDGSNQAQFYPYESAGTNGMLFNAVGKCKVVVDVVDAMQFTSTLLSFLLNAEFAGDVNCFSRVYERIGGSGVDGGVPATLAYTTTQTGSVTTGETDLWSYTVTGNSLNTNGDSLTFDVCVSAANTANSKTVKVYWGGTVIMTTPTIAAQNGDAHIRGTIIRKDATTCYCSVSLTTLTKWGIVATYTSVTATLSSNQIFKVTGTAAVANNDILIRQGKLNWEPVP